MDIPVTPDNTRVLRLVDDFKDFMQRSSQQAGTPSAVRSNVMNLQQGIPFHLPDEEDEPRSFSKRPRLSPPEVMAKARIAQMESRRVSNERAHKMACLDLETRNDKLVSENKILRDRCDKLQLKVKQITIQAIEAQDKLNDTRISRKNEKDKLEEMLLELHTEKELKVNELQTKFDDLLIQNNDLKKQNSLSSTEIMQLQEKLEETTTLLDHKMNRVGKLTQDLKDYETCESTVREQQIKIQDLEMRLSRSSEAEEMSKVMKGELERLPKLDLLVVKLQDQIDALWEKESNVHLMKEKLMSAESKLTQKEQLLEKMAIFELENRDLQIQLNDARSKELQAASSDVLRELQILQQKEATDAHEKNELHSELISIKKKYEILRTSMQNLEQAIDQKNESLNRKDVQIQQLQKRALLLTKERNSLRGILQSYDAELATSSHAEQLLRRAQSAEIANEKAHARLADVEKEVLSHAENESNLRLKVKDLERVITTHQKSVITDGGGDSKALEKELELLRKKVEEIEKERMELEKQRDRLESWVERNTSRGDFDPCNTKVLHFQMNPADLAHKQVNFEVSELKAKCLKLQQKIVQLEADQDITTTDLDLTNSKEFQEKITASELKNQRLKEVFKKRIQEFRQACYALTGYRIDFIHDTQFKLVSMYAEKEADDLLFKMDSSGAMQLLETEYSKTLQNFIKLHLHHQNSIPMFLSSVTADLFGQQTMVL